MRSNGYGVAHAVKICFRYAPAASSVKLAVELMNGALAPLMVLAVASFIDGALAFANGNGHIEPAILAIILIAGYFAYSQVSQVVVRVADKALENALREKLRPQLVRKQTRVSYAVLERAETADLTSLVCGDAEGRMTAILNTGIGIVRLAAQTSGTLFLLVLHIWWALPLFVISAVPVTLAARRGGRAIYERDKVTIKLTRKHYYLSGILVGRETAAERTLFGYADHINRMFSATHLKRSNMNTKTIAIQEVTVNICGLITNAFVIVAVLALLATVGNGAVSHGLFISLAGALIGLARTVTGSVSRLVGDAAGYAAYMRDYARFFALPETEADADRVSSNEDIPFSRLEINNLRFRYAADGEYVLNGVSLKINEGKSYSLIGPNGVGKSTLAKILLGLYRDFEGEILINGVDISEYGADELRRIFSIVYQDFARYCIPLADNITFGDERGDPDHALRLAGLTDVVDKLPQGAKTPFGKVYEGGADISGGEWQKIAIARALYADAPFMILDEPAASLSPTMEGRLYRRFAEITKGKTSLLISHRLGSTKLSDVLFVLDGGVVAETGTHDELIAANGLYAEMFKSQRSWYDER